MEADAERVRGLATGTAGSVLSFVPDLNSAWMPMITFLVYISLNWWATWYPGAEPAVRHPLKPPPAAGTLPA